MNNFMIKLFIQCMPRNNNQNAILSIRLMCDDDDVGLCKSSIFIVKLLIDIFTLFELNYTNEIKLFVRKFPL